MFKSLQFIIVLLNFLPLNSQKENISKVDLCFANQEKEKKYKSYSPGVKSPEDSVFLRIAIIGDAEPKPIPEFPNMQNAVNHINKLSEELNIDFVIGVGDIPHKGTKIQYEEATKVLEGLKLPFFPIMGNEERGSTVERYLYYASKWNNEINKIRYIKEYEKIAFVFVSPDYGRDFNDTGVLWMEKQIEELSPKPVALIVHSSQAGAYPEKPGKGIHNKLFKKNVITQPNLSMIISGDLHMDMKRVDHSKKIGNIHYLHIPALERTKVPDKTNHTPMFRVMTISKDNNYIIETYEVGKDNPVKELRYGFSLN